jgi:hypothetical protein
MLIRSAVVGCAVVLGAGSGVADAAQPAGAAHPVEFWRAVRDGGYALPAGSDAGALALELTDLLASPDPELRDEIAFSTLAMWIYQKPVIGPETLQSLMDRWTANLSSGIGQHDTDTVFRRSFSALALSVAVARDNVSAALSGDDIHRLTDAALAYLAAEQDVRGYDPMKGWMHSAAHTADLLKFLGRSRYLQAGSQSKILDAIAAKLTSAPVVFFNGEDERFARAVLSIVNRADFDSGAFTAWVVRTTPAPMKAHPTIEELRAAQNVKNLFAKLEVLLAAIADARPPVETARSALRGALKDLF